MVTTKSQIELPS